MWGKKKRSSAKASSIVDCHPSSPEGGREVSLHFHRIEDILLFNEMVAAIVIWKRSDKPRTSESA
jgi:hypothetical protein